MGGVDVSRRRSYSPSGRESSISILDLGARSGPLLRDESVPVVRVCSWMRWRVVRHGDSRQRSRLRRLEGGRKRRR
jgi:hypothetical protein